MAYFCATQADTQPCVPHGLVTRPCDYYSFDNFEPHGHNELHGLGKQSCDPYFELLPLSFKNVVI